MTRVHALVAASLLALPSLVLADARPDAAAEAAYKKFRKWMTLTASPAEQDKAEHDPVAEKAAFDRWDDEQRKQGVPPETVKSESALLRKWGIPRLEVDIWNQAFTEDKLPFNHKPNAFLVAMVQGRKPGRALDVSMGQGRNAVFLAQQGWDVTGFDPADKALAIANAAARKLGVAQRLHTVVADEKFDFGKDQWDLIVLSYAGGREWVQQVLRSLKPGGILVLEAFKLQKGQAIGGAVTFGDNELLRLYDGLRILRYEDTVGVGDFGLKETGLVRLLAQKPE